MGDAPDRVALDEATALCDRTDDRAGDDDALIARYIESGPLDLGPSEAQVVDHGVSVWALMTHLHAVGGDIDQAAADYGLDPAAVEAVVRYYCRHRSLIDARILLNRSYFAR
jgi:uncharacterized protein (DUF433 family)